MTEKIYRLRPHHIVFIYGFVLKGEQHIRDDVNRPYPEPFGHLNESKEDYSPEFIDALMSFCSEFVESRGAKLKIVDGGIDDICKLGGGCNRRMPECREAEDSCSTEKISALFGLKSGRKKYEVKDVVEKMKVLKDYLLYPEKCS
jgi:hypothetical protein